MMEILLNLLLTGMFLDSQAKSQATLESIKSQYQLPEAKIRKLAETAPQAKADASVGVKVTAQSVLVLDQDSKKILFEKNSGQVRSIASLTKLMTALVFLDNNPGWEKEITMDSSDMRPGGQTQLMAGEKLTARDAFFAMLVGSANEAAVALSRYTGLSEQDFISQMNIKAEALGMSGAVFKDVTGLDPDNQASAVDVMFLAQEAFNH
ncbi:MAG: serine hydrolase, partial [Patescibacteria group bacterium]